MEFETMLWAAFGCACLFSGVFTIWGARYERTKLRTIVRLNLDSAYEGGQFEPGNYLHGLDASEIACDMTLHACEADSYEAEELEPYVREWLDSRTDILLRSTFKRQEAAE